MDKGREDIREGVGIRNNKSRDKNVVVEDNDVKEEVRGAKGALLEVAAAESVATEEATRMRMRMS